MSLRMGSLAVLLVTLAGSALAGGHIDIHTSALPGRVVAGQVVEVAFTLRYPGGAPVRNAAPVVVARCGSTQLSVPAMEVKTGAYVARVTVPRQGAWAFVVDSKICGNTCALSPLTVVAANVGARAAR